MPPRNGQGVATWLMFIPLLVVPLIAVFGVPQFIPESAQAESSPANELDIGLGTADESPFGEPVTDAQNGGDNDVPVFEPMDRSTSSGDPFQNPDALRPPESSGSDAPRWNAPPRTDESSGDPFADIPKAPNDSRSQVGTPSQPRTAPEFHRREQSDDDSAHSAAVLRENLTWRDAVRKLNQLGVRQYSLEPAAEPHMFRFSCDFTPDDNPRLTHRFEAEAGQPLNAVRKVIQQVEAWLAHRNAP